ncbi:unnamed protein product [Blepharisma stoltei]|uniref:C2H2-type domain-containing protein n=1 Tax=Blepharisma stoltei TaxID=1481888 RepID=A0AAU9J6F4_9CILI|nr:unnamed protein product [Blepharisma stoltei]
MESIENETGFPCPICSNSYPTQAEVMIHIKSHGGQENLCIICDKYFIGKNELSSHLKSHPTCWYCKMKLHNFKDYEDHNLGCHLDKLIEDQKIFFTSNKSGLKRTKCRFCSLILPNRLYALVHVRFVHLLLTRLI